MCGQGCKWKGQLVSKLPRNLRLLRLRLKSKLRLRKARLRRVPILVLRKLMMVKNWRGRGNLVTVSKKGVFEKGGGSQNELGSYFLEKKGKGEVVEGG